MDADHRDSNTEVDLLSLGWLKMQYLAIIPAHNEEKTIEDIIQRTAGFVNRILVVDDHSTDNTREVAESCGTTVIRNSGKKGVGAAMKTGIAYAKKLKPDIVITIDADGQHRPEDIPSLMRPIITREADFVVGSRFLSGRPISVAQVKRFGNRLLSLVISQLSGVRLTDTQSGFRAFNKGVLMSLDLVSDYTYTQEMIISTCHKKFRCAEIPIETIPRKHGKSKVVSRVITYAVRALAIIFSTYLRLKTQAEP